MDDVEEEVLEVEAVINEADEPANVGEMMDDVEGEVEAVINEAAEPANVGEMVRAAALYVLSKGQDLAHVIWGNKEKIAVAVLVGTVTSVDLSWVGRARVNIFRRLRRFLHIQKKEVLDTIFKSLRSFDHMNILHSHSLGYPVNVYTFGSKYYSLHLRDYYNLPDKRKLKVFQLSHDSHLRDYYNLPLSQRLFPPHQFS